MNKILLPRLALLLLLFSGITSGALADTGHPHPGTTLRPFVATYMVTAMGLEGINVTNSLSLSHKGNAREDDGETFYHFKSYSEPVGLLAFKKDETRSEQSEGLIRDNKIYPLKYSFLQIRKKTTRRNVELLFDWDNRKVTNHHKHKNSKWVMDIPESTVDKLSYQLAMMLFLQNNDSRQDKHRNKHRNKEFRLNIADGGHIKEYDFKILGEEKVYTSLGSYKALKIHHHRYTKDKNITLWCAPELNYLPVKIIQEEPGKPDFVSTLISYQEGMTGN